MFCQFDHATLYAATHVSSSEIRCPTPSNEHLLNQHRVNLLRVVQQVSYNSHADYDVITHVVHSRSVELFGTLAEDENTTIAFSLVSFSPSHGSTSGGTLVTLTGNGFYESNNAACRSVFSKVLHMTSSKKNEFRHSRFTKKK